MTLHRGWIGPRPRVVRVRASVGAGEWEPATTFVELRADRTLWIRAVTFRRDAIVWIRPAASPARPSISLLDVLDAGETVRRRAIELYPRPFLVSAPERREFARPLRVDAGEDLSVRAARAPSARLLGWRARIRALVRPDRGVLVTIELDDRDPALDAPAVIA